MKPNIVFMGTPEFAVPVLQNLLDEGYPVTGVVCQPDRPKGRKMKLVPPPVKVLALENAIPVLQPEKVRTQDFEDAVRAMNPDLIVTAAYGRILPANILAVPKRGCLNVHASLLPAYRGAAPIQWCLINGETKTGVTIMMMDEGMDTGDILVQSSMTIPEDMNAGQLSEQLSEMGARLLPAAIDGYLAGDIQPVAQDETSATTVGLIQKATGEIDWRLPSADVHNLIRGVYPWPGAFTWCDGKRIKVHTARVCRDPDVISAGRGLDPGTICVCGNEAISVVCGEGVIDLLEIQSESGKRLHCRDCAHNYRFGQTMGKGDAR